MVSQDEKQALIQSLSEHVERIYDLKVGELNLAEVLTKRTEWFMVNCFAPNAYITLCLLKIDWEGAYNAELDIYEPKKWHKSYENLLNAANGMLDQLRLPSLKTQDHQPPTPSNIYRIICIALIFGILSFVLWNNDGINNWIMQYSHGKQLAIHLSLQVLLICAGALMIPGGKRVKLVEYVSIMASAVGSVVSFLA
jgi:hypothetical protein